MQCDVGDATGVSEADARGGRHASHCCPDYASQCSAPPAPAPPLCMDARTHASAASLFLAHYRVAQLLGDTADGDTADGDIADTADDDTADGDGERSIGDATDGDEERRGATLS